MGKAGGIIGIIGGIFGFFAAIVTLFIGGLGSAFDAGGAGTIVGFGWGGILFSFFAIVCGAIAITSPKNAGIGLIVTSILGAILGGTLVAVCMMLSLIGGILAVIAARKRTVITIPSTTEAEIAQTANYSGATSIQSNTSPAVNTLTKGMGKKRLALWGGIAGFIVIILIIIIVGATSKKSDDVVMLVNAQPCDLTPDGQLAEIFTLGSKYTDLQRENVTEEITGKIIEWRLPVYEVSRSGNGYKIQTKSGVRIGMFGRDVIGTFIHITPHSEEERGFVESLRTDDTIAFRGQISDISMRSLVIKPAILIFQSTPAINDAPSLQPTQPVLQTPSSQQVSTVETTGICQGLDLSITTDNLECINRKFKVADGELNAVYKDLMNRLGDSQRNTLRNAQRTWIKEKEANCTKAGDEVRGGTLEAVVTGDCNVQMTEQRVTFLKNYRP